MEASPALVGPLRGEFVAAAAVRGVAEGPVRAGGTRPGPYGSTHGPRGLLGPVGGFVGAALAREVAAHPLDHLLHHLVLKLCRKKKSWIRVTSRFT